MISRTFLLCGFLLFIVGKLHKLKNKANKGIKITWMEEAFALREYGMELTKHWNTIFHGK